MPHSEHRDILFIFYMTADEWLSKFAYIFFPENTYVQYSTRNLKSSQKSVVFYLIETKLILIEIVQLTNSGFYDYQNI